MILQEGSSQAPLWVNAPPAVPPRVRASGARSSQLLFEQAAGGEGLDRAADMIERQSRMLARGGIWCGERPSDPAAQWTYAWAAFFAYANKYLIDVASA